MESDLFTACIAAQNSVAQSKPPFCVHRSCLVADVAAEFVLAAIAAGSALRLRRLNFIGVFAFLVRRLVIRDGVATFLEFQCAGLAGRLADLDDAGSGGAERGAVSLAARAGSPVRHGQSTRRLSLAMGSSEDGNDAAIFSGISRIRVVSSAGG